MPQPECLLPSPVPNGKLTVVFDLDLTLLEMRRTMPGVQCPCDFIITNEEIQNDWGYFLAVEQMVVTKRPGVDVILKQVNRFAEVVVWSLGCPEYVRGVLRRVDPEGVTSGFIALEPVTQSWYSEIKHNGELFSQTVDNSKEWACFQVKDLSLLGRDLRRVVMVEDTEVSCAYQPDNAIIVPPFRGGSSGSSDNVLLAGVLPVLRELRGEKDVRNKLGITNRPVRTQLAREFARFSHLQDMSESNVLATYSQALSSLYQQLAKQRLGVIFSLLADLTRQT